MSQPEHISPEASSHMLRGIKATQRTLAHRINTPLAIIMGSVELMRLDPSLTPDTQNYLSDIDTQVQEISRVLTDLGRVSRVALTDSPVGESLSIEDSMQNPNPGRTEPS